MYTSSSNIVDENTANENTANELEFILDKKLNGTRIYRRIFGAQEAVEKVRGHLVRKIDFMKMYEDDRKIIEIQLKNMQNEGGRLVDTSCLTSPSGVSHWLSFRALSNRTLGSKIGFVG